MTCMRGSDLNYGLKIRPGDAVLQGASKAVKREGSKKNKEGGEESGSDEEETYVKAKATRAPLTTIKSRMFHKSRK